MSYLEIILIAFGLAMDAFAVAVTAGCILPELTFRPVFRLAFHFGLFQFAMPILGYLGGAYIRVYIESFDHWVAFGLLAIIGVNMIRESFEMKSLQDRTDPTKGKTMIMLSIATSIDALAVGLSLAVLKTAIFTPAVIIGIVAAAMTILGMKLGKKFGHLLGAKMELIAGLILIGIGTKVLAEHFFTP
ncbi:MAG: manganese efflux pump [Phycisphaerae bacterium]|nr:manganese efflux pump [Phycisphaerae bacterium]